MQFNLEFIISFWNSLLVFENEGEGPSEDAFLILIFSESPLTDSSYGTKILAGIQNLSCYLCPDQELYQNDIPWIVESGSSLEHLGFDQEEGSEKRQDIQNKI